MDHKPSIQILNLALIKKRQLVPTKKAKQEGRELAYFPHLGNESFGTKAGLPVSSFLNIKKCI